MPRPADAKIWNEDLVKALKAREDVARRQGKPRAITWNAGWKTIQSTRGDIYTFSNGRIVHLPTHKLSKTVDALCRAVIAGTEPITPPGYVAHQPGTVLQGNPYDHDPYLNRIKKRGGAFAILLAFHVSPANQVLTKAQLCESGQAFCDEEMMENFHAGRPRGAWAAHATLVKHGLVQVQKAAVTYNERVGGLRSNGVNTYTVTHNGKLFIEALLKKNPDCQRQIEAVVGRMAGGMATFDGGATQTGVVHPMMRSVTNNVSKREVSFPTAKTMNVHSNLGKDDRDLSAWLDTAVVGHQKEFSVGKARRQALHNLCDKLNTSVLAGTGTMLRHESATMTSSARSRVLFITLVATPMAAAGLANGRRKSPLVRSLSFSPETPPHVRRPFESHAHLLDSESPSKKQMLISARDAAAQAAWERQALHESSTKAKVSSRITPPSMRTPKRTILLDLSTSDEEESPMFKIERTGVVSKSKPTSRLQPVVLNLSWDSDSDDSVLESVLFKKKAAVPTQTKKEPSQNVVDLAESSAETKPESVTPPVSCKLAIYIDDRERNRNQTPRMLRLELSRLLDNGLLSFVWPAHLPKAIVEERRLDSGDFSFQAISSGNATDLPLLVERKRIGDLVQRSHGKDHWYQLQRMQDQAMVSGGIAVLLLEGDVRTASQFVPYGATDIEVVSPYQHTIDDEESLYRFVGRSILNDRLHCTRFIQAKDEQASLRSIGAFGLMSLLSYDGKLPLKGKRKDGKAERICLKNRLHNSGLPWEMASRIGDEIRSVHQMDLLYAAVRDDECRDRLFLPVVKDLCNEIKLSGTALGWSKAIHKLWFSTLSDATHARDSLCELSHLVKDHAMLLEKLHMGISPDMALDAILSGSKHVVDDDQERIVSIDVCSAEKGIFPVPSQAQSSFYRVNLLKQKTKTQRALSWIAMRTHSGLLQSSYLNIFILDGHNFIGRLEKSFYNGIDCISVAQTVAREIRRDCDALMGARSSTTSQVVLIVRGLNTALDQAAKRNGFRSEVRVIADMIQAELMIAHSTVIVQAVRLIVDVETILRQMALACFYFQLLTEKVSD